VYTSGLGLEENNGSCAEGDAKGETLNEFKYDEPGIYSLNCSDNDNKDNLCKLFWNRKIIIIIII